MRAITRRATGSIVVGTVVVVEPARGDFAVLADREQHAVLALARIDGKNRGDRHCNRFRLPCKSRGELDGVVAEPKSVGRLWRYIEHDSPVVHEPARHLYAWMRDVDEDDGRLAVVADPLVDGPDEVRTLRIHTPRISR